MPLSNKNKFAPKESFQLDPPKDDPITVEELSRANGVLSPKLYVAIKGTVFDVTRNAEAYGVGKGYHVFVGKDASRGLAKSSLKPEDAVADYSDLTDKQKGVLDDWHSFFSQRYNIVGRVVPN